MCRRGVSEATVARRAGSNGCPGRECRMDHVDVPAILGLLVVLLGAAKLLGALARRIGQPAVLGELAAGVLLGVSVFGVIDPLQGHDFTNNALQFLAEIGVIVLL